MGINEHESANERTTTNLKSSMIQCLGRWFPVFQWIQQYRRHWFWCDLSTGFTIVALHIPQGLAYGRLAGVEPIFGLYVSFFPVLIYTIFGTSRQISIGTFAVVSISCRELLSHYETITINYDVVRNQTNDVNKVELINVNGELMRPIDLLIVSSLVVGTILLLLRLFQLGWLVSILPDSLLSSFVVGTSLHVFTSQVYALIGMDRSNQSSNNDNIDLLRHFPLISSWNYIIKHLSTSMNRYTTILSTCTIVILFTVRNYVEPQIVQQLEKTKTKTQLILPIDMTVIVILTILSSVFDFNGQFEVENIPKITGSFTNIGTIPRLHLIPAVALNSILLALIIYVSTYSLERIFADKHDYTLDSNQELFALGISNVFCSFVSCYPCSGSLSRSVVQERIGGQTQLASFISAIMVGLFIAYGTGHLETTPKFVLSCTIIMALMGTMSKFSDIYHYWKCSTIDTIIWIGTFLSVTLFGVDHGLLVGLCLMSIIKIIQFIISIWNGRKDPKIQSSNP